MRLTLKSGNMNLIRCPEITPTDLTKLTVKQLDEWLNQNLPSTIQADFIIREFMKLLDDGWSAGRAVSMLKIYSKVIPVMKEVRRSKSFRAAYAQYRERVIHKRRAFG